VKEATTLAADGRAVATERPAGGRHLDATRDDALREAALELLAEHGYDRLTLEAVAARAGAGKATIYRRWSGKAELVVDAIMCAKEHPVPSDTGSLRGDLRELSRQSMGPQPRLDSEIMLGLASSLPHDTELREAFDERLVRPQSETLQLIFRRAVERGEISPSANVELIASVLPALIFHQILLLGRAPDQEFIDTVVDEIILPLVLGVTHSSLPSTTSPEGAS